VAQSAYHHSRSLACIGQTREVERPTPVRRAGKERRADRAWALRLRVGPLGTAWPGAITDCAHSPRVN
jgi:hypothetical protein